MTDRLKRASLILALALPIAALGIMVARGEVITRSGRAYRISIEGYDPRDLVRGHYLRYRLDFRWEEPRERCTVAECAYCLRGEAGSEPLVVRVGRDDTAGCDASFPETQLDRLQQFFIPEDRGPVLERALRSRDAKLLVKVSRGGSVVIQDLLLDGRPWREVVQELPP
jgi:uncharacterized membrane-anchored protein